MTPEQLIAEGRKLERPCKYLLPHGTGPVAAVWYERDEEEIEATGNRCWITVDARQIPSLSPSVTGFITVLTKERSVETGWAEVTPSWPERVGTPLYAHPASLLPPLAAVFARGSDAIDVWLAARGRKRTDRFLDCQEDAATTGYQEVWNRETPYFAEDMYAVLGGWHMPWPEDDWKDLLDDQLLVWTLRDPEPWVEVWHTRTGQFQVMQRIT
jgi:hypothetical protein